MTRFGRAALSPVAGLGRAALSPADRLTWAVHSLLVAVLLWRHEPWRDELQAWSIAMATDTPWQLFPNTRLEGRPPGWQLLLWPFAQITTSVRVLQLVAFIVGLVAAWWWLRLASLAWWLKALVMFGFLFTGGYFVHARDYVLSFMLLVLSVAVYRRHGTGWRLAVMLCLLAFANAFSLAMAAAFVAAAWLGDAAVAWRGGAAASRRRLEWFGSAALCVAWCAWAAYLTYPTEENQFQVGKYKGFGQALTKSFIPLNYEWAWLARIDDWFAALLLLGVLAYAWSRSLVAFGFAVLSFAMLLYNLTYGYGDYWWHFGNAMLVTMTVVCFAARDDGMSVGQAAMGGQPAARGRAVLGGLARVGTVALVIIAALDFAANRYGAGPEVYSNKQYSMTQIAAQQIEAVCDGCTVIVDWDAVGAGVSAHLDGRELYYLNRREFGTFAKFSNKNTPPTWDDAIAAMQRFDKPIFVHSGAYFSGSPPCCLMLMHVNGEGRHDTNLVWQLEADPVVPED
ncbi:MAG: hypothetical protein ACO30G_06495 [Ilumatobacteraceae bacterium]